MTIDKKWYFEEFSKRAKRCLELEEKLLVKELPKEIRFHLGTEDIHSMAIQQGKVKFLGGRYLSADQTNSITIQQAAEYTFVDGKVPQWLNMHYVGYDNQYSYIRLYYCKELADSENKLYLMPDGTKLFRIMLSEEHQLNNWT